MAPRRFTSYSRRPLGSLVVSLFIVAAGFGATLCILMAAAPDNRAALVAAVVAFALIAAIPLRALRPTRSPRLAAVNELGFWKTVLGYLRPDRGGERELRHRLWKRKKTTYVSTPPGTEYIEIHASERRQHQPHPANSTFTSVDDPGWR